MHNPRRAVAAAALLLATVFLSLGASLLASAHTMAVQWKFHDLGPIADLVHVDLTRPPDLTHPPDLTRVDLTVPPDLTVTGFNLAVEAGGRYLTNNGTPISIDTRSMWFMPVNTGSFAEAQTALADTASKGYTGVILQAITTPSGHFPTLTTAPNLQGGAKPFTTCVAHDHSGNTNLDETGAQTAYWNFLDSIVDDAGNRGLVVLLYFNYLSQWGVGTDNEGWGYVNAQAHNTASSFANCTAFGTFIGNRYGPGGSAGRKHVLLSTWGDTDDAHSNSTERSCQQAMWAAIRAVAPTAIYGGETGYPDGLVTDQSTTGWGTVAPLLNYAYFNGPGNNAHPEVTGQRAWAVSGPRPAYAAEGPYSGVGQTTTQARVSRWRSRLGGFVAGVNQGTSGIWDWPVGSATGHLSDTTEVQHSVGFLAFFHGIQWWRLQPVLNGAAYSAFVTSGQGAWDTDTYAPCAKASANDLAVCYLTPNGTGAKSITIAVSALSGSYTAKWFDPTSGGFTSIGTGLSNSGTRVFTTPGNNGAGDNDWALLLTVP